MFERGYEQKKYVVWFNRDGRFNMVLFDKFHDIMFRRYDLYGNPLIQIPRNAKTIDGIMMWDADMNKGAIKLGKIGAHSMGIAK